MDYGKLAVIPTHNRPEQLDACVALIDRQVHHTFVIDNASDEPIWYPCPITVIRDEEQPPNLSRLWNVGLSAASVKAQEWGLERWYTAVLNDDALPPAGWMDAVCQAMEDTGAVAGCSHPFGGPQEFLGADVGPGVGTRLTGWAFVLRQPGLNLDEQFRWWYGDDDLSTRARLSGGIVYVEGFPVPNTLANSSTNGVRAEQAAVDGQLFAAKWGRRAW